MQVLHKVTFGKGYHIVFTSLQLSGDKQQCSLAYSFLHADGGI